MLISGIGSSAAIPRGARQGDRAPQDAAPAASRALIPVAAPVPSERATTLTRRPLAAFLAHLIATQTQAPQTESYEEGYEYESAEDQFDVDENPWAYRFWSPFNHVEQRDSRVVIFADHLPPGVHVASFVARATTPGTFLLKPAHGELMYEPEVFGRSEGGSFEVLIPPQVSSR